MMASSTCSSTAFSQGQVLLSGGVERGNTLVWATSACTANASSHKHTLTSQLPGGVYLEGVLAELGLQQVGDWQEKAAVTDEAGVGAQLQSRRLQFRQGGVSCGVNSANLKQVQSGLRWASRVFANKQNTDCG